MRPFDYVEPETLEEALEILAGDPDDTLVMAGGTSLVILMKQDLVRPSRVVGLRRLAQLRAVDAGGEGLRLGALATHQWLPPTEGRPSPPPPPPPPLPPGGPPPPPHTAPDPR